MNWDAVTAIASVISMIAFVATAIFVAEQVKALEKQRYHEITSDIYSIWESRDFMDAQLWLMHRLEQKSWAEFVAVHRADYGELAFHRVGSFYDRVGTLVRLKLIDEKEILSTIGAYAIAVWQKIEPLVREARLLENSLLFDDFEAILPACYECYVPTLRMGDALVPFSVPGQGQPGGASGTGAAVAATPAPAPAPAPAKPRLTSIQQLRKRMRAGEPIAVLDVRQPSAAAADPRHIPGAIVIRPDDVPNRLSELPRDREIVAYCA